MLCLLDEPMVGRRKATSAIALVEQHQELMHRLKDCVIGRKLPV